MLPIQKEIRSHTNAEKAKFAQRFFKTGKGEYAEGDQFLGLTVPETRSIVKKYTQMSLEDMCTLIKSPYHEERLAAVLLFKERSEKSDFASQKNICRTYLHHASYVNNWDIVDVSAPSLVGPIIQREGTALLTRLARSKNLWERRIAIVSTMYTIRHGSSREVQEIADILLDDDHDLIQKAVGWMLREMGKVCGESVLFDYIKTRYIRIPRTALRYAIERFSEVERKNILKGLLLK